MFSFEGVPAKLEHLLCNYNGGEGEAALYRCIYGILWVSLVLISEIVIIQFSAVWLWKDIGRAREGASHPTYIYPPVLKAVIRARNLDAVKAWSDPQQPEMSQPIHVYNSYNRFPAHLPGLLHHL